MRAVVWCFEHSSVLPFLGIGMRIDLFQSCGHCCVFQICWHIEPNILVASSFRVLNSSTGIPSHPLTFLTAVLPEAHWLHTPECLALRDWPHHHGYLVLQDLFLYNSSMHSFRLFLISSSSTRSTVSVLYCAHFGVTCSRCISNFPEICRFPPSVVFFYSFALFTEEDVLAPSCCSLALCV